MKAIYVILLSIAPAWLMAQATLSGLVTDENGDPLPGAGVELDESGKGTATNEQGRFVLQMEPGEHSITITFLGYEDHQTTLNVKGKRFIKVALETKTEQLADEVIISATRAGKNTPTTFTNVSKEELEKQNMGQDMPMLLEMTPSVVSASDAGAGIGYTNMRIRGTDQSRINVTINGIPYNDAESQGVFWVNLPDFASSVSDIQIQRGVGTSTNGASAFGATVNVQTTELNREPYAEIGGMYGSFNSWRTTAKAGTGLIKDHFTFDARGSIIKSDGYIDRAESDLSSFFLSGGYYGDKTIVRANVFGGHEVTYQAWNGVPEDSLETNRTFNVSGTDFFQTNDPHHNEVDDYQQYHYQLLVSHQLNDNWLLNGALHYTRGRGFFEQFKVSEAFSSYGFDNVMLDNDTITTTDLIRRRWLDNDFYGLTYSVKYTKNKWQFILGGAANRYVGDHFGEIIWAEYAPNIENEENYYDGIGIKLDISNYAKVNYQVLPKLNLFADVQYRFVSHDIDGTDNDLRTLDTDVSFNFINPKAGLSFSINRSNSVYLSYAMGNREPSRSDLIDAPLGRQPTNETLHNVEAGYEFRRPGFSFSANYYLMYYKDQLVQTGELNDVGAPIRVNVDNSYRTGAELMMAWQPHRMFRWDANLTYSINRIKEFTEVLYVYDANYTVVETQENTYENTPISFSPNWIAGNTFSFTPVSGLELALQSKFVSEQYLDNTGSEARSIDPFFVSDLRLNYSLRNKWLFREVVFTLLVNNVFNHEYESNGYTFSEAYTDGMGGSDRVDYNYYYPQAGINFMGGVTVKF